MNTFRGVRRSYFLSAAAILAGWSVVAAPQTGSGKFREVKGNVMLDSAPAKVGDVANPGNLIVTGGNSTAKIYLGINGPDLVVLENSRVTLEDLVYDKSGSEPTFNTTLKLTNGRLRGRVNKSSSLSSFVVKAPTTTAAIRGTIFEMASDGAVLVWEGVVDVSWTDPATGKVINFVVAAGQKFNPATGQVETLDEPNPFGPEFYTPDEVDVIYGNEPVPGIPFSGPVGPRIVISPVLGKP